MISMGFKDDLESILNAVPEGSARTWLFSATMSPEVCIARKMFWIYGG